MLKYFFLLLVFMSCSKEKPFEQLTIKIKPIFDRDMKLWTIKNSQGKSYVSPPKSYPAYLKSKEGVLKGKLKLRGDLKKHWANNKKSYRFKASTGAFQQLKEMDFILIEDKQFELEPFGYMIGKDLGLLVPRSKFIYLQYNNQDLGVYFVLERWSADSLEIRGLPPGPIIGEANAWLDILELKDGSLYKDAFYNREQFNPLALKPHIYRLLFPSPSSVIGFTRFSEMLGEMTTLLKVNPKFKAGSYVDLDQAVSWSALIMLMGAYHSVLGDNLRWYYHPYQRKFRPIPYDFLPEHLKTKDCLWKAFSNMNPWMKIWGQNETFKDLLKTKLRQISQTEYLEEKWKQLAVETNFLQDEIFLKDHELRKNLIFQNGETIRNALNGKSCLI